MARKDQPGAFFSPEATDFAKRAVEGKTVVIALLKERTRDRYDRLLAFVYLPGSKTTLNELLIATGHGYADWRFCHPLDGRFVYSRNVPWVPSRSGTLMALNCAP